MSAMYSMTGFARAEHKTSSYHLVWELKTVNQRFLETSFRLPESLRSIEQPLRDQARKALARGKLEANLKLEDTRTDGTLSINEPLLEALLEGAKQVAAKAPNAEPMSQGQLMAWPGVLQHSDNALTDIAATAMALFAESLERLIDARASEGAQLQRIIQNNLDAIDEQIRVLEPIAAKLPGLQLQRLQQRVDALELKIDHDRLAQEVVLLAQKADVREELDRLQIHVAQGNELIAGEGPHGRRLDFLTQELNREANTLGAKAVCNETSAASIELKVIIEQIREQVQNIE